MKKNVILSIDTSNNEEIVVGLTIDGEKFTSSQKVDKRSSQIVLQMIDEILKKHDISLQDLTNIEVATGPGSFTGLRVGVSIANALAWSLQIPINGKKVGELVEPEYE